MNNWIRTNDETFITRSPYLLAIFMMFLAVDGQEIWFRKLLIRKMPTTYICFQQQLTHTVHPISQMHWELPLLVTLGLLSLELPVVMPAVLHVT